MGRAWVGFVLGVVVLGLSRGARAQTAAAAPSGPASSGVEIAPPEPRPAASPPPPLPPAPAAPEPAPAAPEERTAVNVFYVEGLGAALFYSVNYERAFGDVSGRIGAGYYAVNGSSWLGVPITLSYLGIGSKKHMFEIGAGVSIHHFTDASNPVGLNSSNSDTFVFGTVILGYRMQPPKGGFLLRAGISPLFNGDAFVPWPYLALGATF
jgi:hypothetical protein